MILWGGCSSYNSSALISDHSLLPKFQRFWGATDLFAKKSESNEISTFYSTLKIISLKMPVTEAKFKIHSWWLNLRRDDWVSCPSYYRTLHTMSQETKTTAIKLLLNDSLQFSHNRTSKQHQSYNRTSNYPEQQSFLLTRIEQNDISSGPLNKFMLFLLI
jgi:hypothetical protein